MDTILHNGVIANLGLQSGGLPVPELEEALGTFLEPVTQHLPEKRLRAVARLAVQGGLGGQSPLVTQMARGVSGEAATIWPMTKRLYWFIWNERFSHRDLLKGLYGVAQRAVAEGAPADLVVALGLVNFEKPDTRALEGVSTVMKATPPGPRGAKRLTPGYPAMTATVVNWPTPVVTYASPRRGGTPWPPYLSITSTTPGLSTCSSGCVAWGASSAWPLTVMALMSCWPAFVLSL